MIKGTVIKLALAISLLCFAACEIEQEDYPDIRIGKEKPTDEMTLNKGMEKRIILSGGNGKYVVNVENSRIATARMSADTLKVTGLLEGETFLTVISHDKRAKLKINVTYPELGVSHSTITLRPQIKDKTVSISGGGELTRIEENDPTDVIDIKWDGTTGMLEITPKYEGKAEIVAISEGGKEKQTITVNVNPDGELDGIGCYATTSSSYFKIVNNKMVAKRKGMGTWIGNSARPYGGNTEGTYKGSHMRISPVVNAVQGDTIDLEILEYVWDLKKEIAVGKHRVSVEEVNEAKSEVVLLGKGFKFLLPYENR